MSVVFRPRLRVGVLAAVLAIAGAIAGAATATRGSHTASCGYAFVFPTPIGTNQSEQDIKQGLEKAARTLHVPIKMIENQSDAALTDNIRAVASKGCYAAIGTAFFNYGQQIGDAAKDFPNTSFFIDGGPATEPNVVSYDFKYEQGTFVAGAIAAKMTRSRKIGILLGLAIPTLNRYKNGFIAGAHFVNPKIKVSVGVVGSFTDPARGATLAIAQAGTGVDVIYPATGSNLEIFHQARAHKYKVIGSDFVEDSQAVAKGYGAAALVADDQAGTAYAIMRDLVKNHPTTGTRLLGIKDGVFAIPGVNYFKAVPGLKSLPVSVLGAAKAAYQAILTGKVTIKNPTS